LPQGFVESNRRICLEDVALAGSNEAEHWDRKADDRREARVDPIKKTFKV